MEEKLTWKKVFSKNPGPKTIKEALILFFKGAAMGAADIIPGVSGGTIAFISGIYEKLIFAVSSFNAGFFKKIVRGRVKEAFIAAHFKFLAVLFLGIIFSVLSISRLMNYLIINHGIHTWSFFFGLIAASVFAVGGKIKKFWGFSAAYFAMGLAAGYFLFGLIPLSTPSDWWFIFFSGLIAITAMILPGISGAFILLLLGKYQFMTAALKDPFILDNFFIIIIFCSGCVFGLLSFARLMGFLFKKYYTFTVAFLTGLIAGSLRKIWPWKEKIDTGFASGPKEINIMPEFNPELLEAFILIFIGAGLVALLSSLSRKKKARPF